MISTLHLKYYLEIVRFQSISAAAEYLDISQPMLSRILKSMEAEVGTPLVKRSTRSFVMTEAGVILRNYALKIMHNYDEMINAIKTSTNENAGHVRLSCTGMLLNSFFAEMLPIFSNKYPNISISVIQEQTRKIPVSIIDSTSDIGIVLTPIKAQQFIESKTIFNDELALLINTNHPLANKAEVSLADLKGENLLLTGETSAIGERFIINCKNQGFNPNVLYNCHMPEFIRMSVISSNAIGVMARPLANYYATEGMKIAKLVPKISWEVAVIRRKDSHVPKAVELLFDSICEYSDSFAQKYI